MVEEIILLAIRLMLSLVLYAFLGTFLYFLIRDLRSASRANEQIPKARLILAGDPEVPQIFKLEEVNLIGRTTGNTIRLPDETVSAHHARLTFYGGQWWLEDLGSRNGTTVNEFLVEEPVVLTYGDRICLGKVELLLEAGVADKDLSRIVPHDAGGEDGLMNSAGE